MTNTAGTKRQALLIADDMEINRAILVEAFGRDYEVIEAENGVQAWEKIREDNEHIAAVLLDIVMPEMDGFGVLEKMTESRLMDAIPVFLITSETSEEALRRGYEMGVVDIIAKPFNPAFIRRRLSNIIELYKHRLYLQETVAEQMEKLELQERELRETNSSIIDTLSTAIEFRDCESGAHVHRIRSVTSLLLKQIVKEFPEYNVPAEKIQLIADAAVMHDVGKISIPDSILNKPGRLTAEEFEIMKTHTIKGCELLDSIEHLRRSELYQYCYDICRHHHERWDGKGYPDGLKQDQISIWAQTVSLADVYDALVSERVYKPAYPHDEAVGMILSGECGMFNPKMLSCFDKMAASIHEALYRE